MATSTTNYGLRKPATTDYVNVQTDLNANFDVIDSTMKDISDDVVRNAADIATNTEDIATNAENIAQNTSDIANRTAYKIVRIGSVETQAISDATVFHFDFTVPTGYTIVCAWDDSNYAGYVAAPIRINTGSGTKRVTMTYYGTVSTARQYTCAALMMQNVTIS